MSDINWNTELIQEDGKLYYKIDGELILASYTDICKHYRTMQYNISTSLGCSITDRADLINAVLREEIMWLNEYIPIPENCIRIK